MERWQGEPKEEHMDYLEFMARVTAHILDKGQVMIRFYGLCSNAHRGLPLRKQGKDMQGRSRCFSSANQCGQGLS